MTAPTWSNERRKLSALIPWPRNPRKIEGESVRRLQESFEEFGQPEVIAISPSNDVYNGHQRLKSWFAKFGDIEVDVRVSSRPLTEKERERLTVLLHRGAVGEWNFETLANEFEVGELLEWGFTEMELGLDGAGAVNGDAEPQIDRAAELRQKWGVEAGDLWRVGEHRLICGDCTDRAVVERVMGGERADCVITSPPYLNQRKYTEDSELSDWDGLMSGCFSSALCTEDCQVFVNLGMVHDSGEWSDYWSQWVDWMRSAGWKRFGLYVWDQGAGLPGDWAGRLAPAFEFVFHFNKQSRRPEKWIDSKLAGQIASKRTFRHDDGRLKPFTQNGVAVGDTKIPDSVIRVNRQIGDTGHPAPYSEAFVGFLVRTYSGDSQIIYEPFSGSGTTMVACENLGRRCRAVEIAPGYVAVALERMATAFPGIVIERVGNDATVAGEK